MTRPDFSAEIARRLAAGQKLLEQGLVVVPYVAPWRPIPQAGKRPHWRSFPDLPEVADEHTRVDCTDLAQLAHQLELDPLANLAILGVCQVDADSPEAIAKARDLGVTSDAKVWIIRTRRGYRALYRPAEKGYPDLRSQTKNGDPGAAKAGRPVLDLDFLIGGPAIVPPSVHPSGVPYRWIPGHTPAEIPFSKLCEPPVLVLEHWNNLCHRKASGPAPAQLDQGPGLEAAIRAHLEFLNGRRMGSPSSSGWIGGNHCPWPANHNHGDRHPGFSVNFVLGVWKCHGACGSGSLLRMAQDLGLRVSTIERVRGGRVRATRPVGRIARAENG